MQDPTFEKRAELDPTLEKKIRNPNLPFLKSNEQNIRQCILYASCLVPSWIQLNLRLVIRIQELKNDIIFCTLYYALGRIMYIVIEVKNVDLQKTLLPVLYDENIS